jgi:hypothetical protein
LAPTVGGPDCDGASCDEELRMMLQEIEDDADAEWIAVGHVESVLYTKD